MLKLRWDIKSNIECGVQLNRSFKALLILAAFISNPKVVSAHSGATDRFGCHVDHKIGGYHCHAGPYDGKTFANKSEGLRFFEDQSAAKEVSPKKSNSTIERSEPLNSHDLPSMPDNLLSVVSWNMKHLGRDSFDVERATAMLLTADIVVFQEVNQSLKGQKSLKDLRDNLASKLKLKMCWALSEFPSDEQHERYGYLWKNKRVAYVKTNGQAIDNCPETAFTIRLGVKHAEEIIREPSVGNFLFKPQLTSFTLAGVHLVPTSKHPEAEVEPLFDTFSSLSGPVIVAGDYNLDDKSPAFATALRMGFSQALHSEKTSLKRGEKSLNKSYDNFWFRDILLERHVVLNLFEAFPNLTASETNTMLSDHSPIQGFFRFTQTSQK